MDLVTVILFLVLYYVRPQEWSSAFSAIHFVQIVLLVAISTLFTRSRSLGLADLFQTPHDWMIFGFWLWLVMSAPSPWSAFKDYLNLYIFYIVVVQTLYSVPRMILFVGWWTYLVVFISLLALASQWGIDPLGSADLTQGPMQGRLSLNLSIFNNPNALGHSAVPAIPMLFFYCIWRRPIISRLLGTALLSIPIYCIYLTQSKGSFLSGGVTIVATALFGRPKTFQIIVIVAVLMFGSSAVYMLPRMNEIAKSKTDPAIQGRVAAFKHGYNVLTITKTGVGKGNWFTSFFAAHHYYKAAHSTYVMIGGELGYPGLFFLCGVFFCCLRTLVTARTDTSDEERLRRMLFVLVVSYMVSSWMVNFEYRATFFMFAGATAALHRHLHGILREPEKAEEESEIPLPVWRAAMLPRPAAEGVLPSVYVATSDLLTESQESLGEPAPSPAFSSRIGGGWNRIGWFDIAMTSLMVWALVKFWAYIMMRM